MRLVINPDFEKCSNWAADYVAYKIKAAKPTKEKPFVMALPAGSSPLKMFKRLIELFKKGKISFQDEHGIQPLLIQIKKKGLKNAIAVDKVIGKAAALLMVYGKVKQVHTNIIAKDAITVFEKYKVKYSYNEIVDYIQNVKKDGLCPMEQKVLNVNSPKKAYKIFTKQK